MKKVFSIACALLIASVFVYNALAVELGTVTTTVVSYLKGETRIKVITFTCVGSVDDNGSIPDTDFNELGEVDGWYLYSVKVDPGTTQPDAGDVFIMDENDMDLLGSIDGGTTAYNGLNLIHATLTKMAIPSFYDTRAAANLNYFHMINGTLTLVVANQATNSATYVIECTFIQ